MAAPLNTCTTIEQRGVVRFLWAKNMEAKDIHKEMLPMWAAFPCPVLGLFEPAIPGSERPQAHTLAHAPTGIRG
jgi:hypothetical protein